MLLNIDFLCIPYCKIYDLRVDSTGIIFDIRPVDTYRLWDIFLDLSVTLKMSSERFSLKLSIIEVQKVMGSRK